MGVNGIFRVVAPIAFLVASAAGQDLATPVPRAASITGTVTDVKQHIVPGAQVTLEAPGTAADRNAVSKENGSFIFREVPPGGPYRILISAPGYADWTSPPVHVQPGQFVIESGIQLRFSGGVTSVTVHASSVEIATQQVTGEVHQRVLGIVPNFYVVYDKDPAPMTTKLKFLLAIKASTDPITFLGASTISAVDQAADTPSYGQGFDAYGKRCKANYLNGLTDIMIGGAVLPSLLHQDPRYFYQGTGSRKSRLLHALINPFVTRGDNKKRQPNFSSLGGYFASGAIANTYYPEPDRGLSLTLGTAGIDIGADIIKSILNEFFLRGLTRGGGSQDSVGVPIENVD